jgi:DNA repair exonuclease SbcCD ATPase subunit
MNLLTNVENNLQVLTPAVVKKTLVRYESLASELSALERDISGVKLSREKNKNSIARNELELKDVVAKIAQYNQNKEAIENLEGLMNKKVDLANKQIALCEELEGCEAQTLETVKLIGSHEQKIQTLKEQKIEYSDLQNSYAAYDLFMQCMHPNGIAYDVIKKKIPVINQEIAKVLANIVEFEIFFESSGNKFDIFIKHPQYDERPIEMASGAEKTMAAMAIRLALLSVSSLPKSDLFILDEPGTALDEENMEGFIRILELIKVYFKNVLLISHLDSLKDCVDMQIVIDKKAGYAKVNQ